MGLEHIGRSGSRSKSRSNNNSSSACVGGGGGGLHYSGHAVLFIISYPQQHCSSAWPYWSVWCTDIKRRVSQLLYLLGRHYLLQKGPFCVCAFVDVSRLSVIKWKSINKLVTQTISYSSNISWFRFNNWFMHLVNHWCNRFCKTQYGVKYWFKKIIISIIS